jgi:UDP-GlcNAc:undecaprenyl-phosphate GlcNAc-1-phosphate transferase
MIAQSWLYLLATAGIATVLSLLLRPLAERIGLLDHPAERKVHKASTPLVGGIAIYIAFTLAVYLATPFGNEALPLLLACGLMLLTGVLDDLYELSAKTRIGMQILACCIMIFMGDVELVSFGKLLWDGTINLGWFSIPMTIFAVVGVINAFNMMDGVDGLSSCVFIVAGLVMAWLAMSAGRTLNAEMLLIAVSATSGFFILNARFPWNRRAKIFLGDSGSLFLGMFLAWQCVDLGGGPGRAFSPMTAVWLMAIPILDTVRLILHRWRLGQSSMQADQFHLHHAFLKAGFSAGQTTAAIAILVAFTGLTGLAGELWSVPSYKMFYGFVAFALFYLLIMRLCWTNGRFLGRDVQSEWYHAK